MQEHIAYLGTVVADGTVYTGHLYDAGPGSYAMQVRFVDAEGVQMTAAVRVRRPNLESAVTWGVLTMLESILEAGADLADMVTIHAANMPGIDPDLVMLAVEARAIERATEEAARATRH